MTDDWNPNDPDATRVLYDLDRWSFSQQAELAAELAEAEIPHTWEGSELVVPESHEALADSTIERVEQRLGIINTDDDLDEITSGGPSQPASPAEPIDIPVGVAATEYDLTEWAESDRQAITLALTGQRIPYRWEDDLLLVGTDHEDVVESLMDLVETGDFASLELAAGVSESGGAAGRDDDDDLPFETLNTFFLAAERLQRNTQDADGLEQLLDALEVAEPGRRPYGVDVGLWQRTCELADELAGSLVDGDEPDHNTAMAIATDLHDLLRPHI